MATVGIAVPRILSVVYELWVREEIGLTTSQIEDRVNAALTAFCEVMPIGGDLVDGAPLGLLHRSAIAGAIADAIGRDYLVRLEVTFPGSDESLRPDEVPVFTGATATIHLVAGGV